MTSWTNAELAKIAAADELQIAPRRRDGTLQSPVTIWVVRHGDDLYVRSVKGSTAGWFKGTQLRHEGGITAGGVKKDVMFEKADDGLNPEIDRAYRAKYHRYAASIVDSVLTPKARATTMRLAVKKE